MNFLKKLFDEKNVGEIKTDETEKAEIGEAEAEASDLPEETVKEELTEVSSDGEKPACKYSLKEISELCGDKDVSAFVSDILSDEFAVFADGRGGTLAQKHEAFIKLKALMKSGDVKEKVTDEKVSDTAREHSGFSGTYFKDYSSGLTARQMEIARDAGMSYREYSELLESVPSKTRNRI